MENIKRNPLIPEEALKRIIEVQERRDNKKIFCYNCKNETKQKVLFNNGELVFPNEIVFFDDKGERTGNGWTIDGWIWKIYQCQGCERMNLIVYRRISPYEDDMPIHHFPTKEFRPFPIWITHLNKDFTEIFSEIYSSLNSGNLRLPLMGARTVLDMFIVKKIGDVGSFKAKLQKLVDNKLISQPAHELLEIALEYGHAAIHRGHVATKEEIHKVLDIIENLIRTDCLISELSDLKKPSR